MKKLQWRDQMTSRQGVFRDLPAPPKSLKDSREAARKLARPETKPRAS